MEINYSMALLFLFVATVIVIYWIYQGYLHTFIKHTLAIIRCAFSVILSPFIRYFYVVYPVLKRNIYDPIRKAIHRIHIPLGIRIITYLILGIGILALDYFYNTKIFEADETTFYHAVFQGKTYWMTKNGLIVGGFFFCLGLFLFLMELLRVINTFISRPISIFITIQK
ncbi:MAG: hypothetical protein V1917_01090 [Candidatus Gottesmanbacteria bacterium]